MARNSIAGPPPLPPADPQILVTVGDIACSATRVYTPNGEYSLAGTTWIVTQQTTVRERIPTYAIVLAVLFVVFCFLGLLFLAIREQRLEGFVQVSVQAQGFYYATQVPVGTPAQVFDTEQRVNYIRGLVAALPA
ncbi:hypothetical protein [Nocardia transvalensis]|uniref:hypothetical protein n=1 Tax=Nocardia transvalensis TaxID=37333 RepID=UPI00189392D7|nr:hypothetical protein [Nocardia transvalensis]MBF6331266.1 hypothetical protein [Nocardia transvalensis]